MSEFLVNIKNYIYDGKKQLDVLRQERQILETQEMELKNEAEILRKENASLEKFSTLQHLNELYQSRLAKLTQQINDTSGPTVITNTKIH